MKPLQQVPPPHVPARHANATAPLRDDAARAVVLELNDMIGEAIAARDTLVRIYGLGGEYLAAPPESLPVLPSWCPPLADLDTDPVAPSASAPTVKPARKPAKKKAAEMADDSEFGLLLAKFDKRGEPQKEICRALVNLPRTFNTEKLAEALGIEMKLAYQTTDRLKARGILERVGMGLWHRIVPAVNAGPQSTLDAIKAKLPASAPAAD